VPHAPERLVVIGQGSTELVHSLLAHDLVDAMSLFTVPVVLGGGKKLFADGSAPGSGSV
jgi:dihydrofolate reductase